MTIDDMRRPEASDISAALGLLTRLPVPVDTARATARGAAAAWAWPVAGMCAGLIAGAAGALALWLGLAPAIAAAVALGALMMVTGAMHEDGLADSADGLWGGEDKTRRLAIMKDSHIGTYGVLALLVVTLIRWTALTQLTTTGDLWAALLAAGALSRAPMAVVMAALPNARGTGLAQSVGRPPAVTAAGGIVVALGLGVLFLGTVALWLVIPMAITTLAVASVARRRIGGQTGDILGAVQQLAEAAILATLAAQGA